MGLADSAKPSTYDPQAGITLVEVMITLFVIALAASAIVMNLPASPSPLVRAEARLGRFVSNVFENAQLRGQAYIVSIEDNQLILRQRRGETWTDLDTQRLPENVSGFQRIDPAEASVAQPDSPDAILGPHLDIFPIGFMESGNWVLSYRGEEVEFAIATDGSLTRLTQTRRRRR